MTVEGLNLANAQGIVFDQAGIKGRIVRVKELPICRTFASGRTVRRLRSISVLCLPEIR